MATVSRAAAALRFVWRSADTTTATAPDHDRAADQDRPRDRLREDQPAEEHGHDRVHVRVGGHERDRRDAEHPHVRREGDHRAERDEVRPGEPRVERRRGGQQVLATDGGEEQQPDGAEQHLVDGQDEGVLRQRQPRRRPRPERPEHRGAHDDQAGADRHVALDALRADEQHEAGEAQQHAEQRPSAGSVTGEPPVDDHPERDRRHEQRGDARRCALVLAHRHQAVAERGQEQPERRAAHQLAPRRAQPPDAAAGGQDRGEEQAGHEVPPARRRHRREVLDHHPDRQVGRAPHDVDDAERDRDEPRRRWHGHRGCHRQTAVLLLHPAMLGR